VSAYDFGNLSRSSLHDLLLYTREAADRQIEAASVAGRSSTLDNPVQHPRPLPLIQRLRLLLSSSPSLPHCDLASDIPPETFICPLTGQIYDEPVHGRCYHVFEKSALKKSLSNHPQCPIQGCQVSMAFQECKEHTHLSKLILKWIGVNPLRRDPKIPPPLPQIHEEIPPEEFQCPIAQEGIMDDPVYTPCKHAFERRQIEEWLKQTDGKSPCPLCRAPVDIRQLHEWKELSTLIHNWKDTHPLPSIENPPSSDMSVVDTRPKGPIETTPTAITFRKTARSITWLLDYADLINLKNPRQRLQIKTLLKAHSNFNEYLTPYIHEVYLNVYLLHSKQLGQPSLLQAKFGEHAFCHCKGFDTSQNIRQMAIHLVALRYLALLFHHQEHFDEANLLYIFDRLPQDLHDGIYETMPSLTEATPPSLDPEFGKKSFRGVDGFFSSNQEKATAIKTYLEKTLK